MLPCIRGSFANFTICVFNDPFLANILNLIVFKVKINLCFSKRFVNYVQFYVSCLCISTVIFGKNPSCSGFPAFEGPPEPEFFGLSRPKKALPENDTAGQPSRFFMPRNRITAQNRQSFGVRLSSSPRFFHCCFSRFFSRRRQKSRDTSGGAAASPESLTA